MVRDNLKNIKEYIGEEMKAKIIQEIHITIGDI